MKQPNGQAHHHRGRPPRLQPAPARPPGRGAARVRSLSGSVVVIVVILVIFVIVVIFIIILFAKKAI